MPGITHVLVTAVLRREGRIRSAAAAMRRSRRRRSTRVATLATWVCGLTLAGLASAHECWLAPSSWSPGPGERVGLSLLIGHVGDVRSVPRREDHLRRFVHRRPDGTIRDVPGAVGRAPVGTVESASPGLNLFAYEGHWMHSQLGASRFDGYLKEKGLESIRSDRASRGESDRPGTERYRRACVAMVQVGPAAAGAAAAGADVVSDSSAGDGRLADATDFAAAFAALELPVAIVPVTDPATYGSGTVAVFEIRAGNQPLVDVQVAARVLAHDPGRVQTVRSDEHGRVRFAIDRPGAWLVDAVTMQRCPDGTIAPNDHRSMPGVGVDWESTWASLTFDVAGEPPAGATDRNG